MKIVLAAAPVRTGDMAFNVETMRRAVADWSGRAELIVFGESVLQGFDCLCFDYARDAETGVDVTGEPIRALREAAREGGIALSFGFIRRREENLYSCQIFIDAGGEIVELYHRVSPGWKEISLADGHYREGEGFHCFSCQGRRFAIALCGDLWTEDWPEKMGALSPEILLWPVWCDYDPGEWNGSVKEEYAVQAARCGKTVLLVNPYCADGTPGCAAGGCACFREGKIVAELPAGEAGCLLVEV